MRPQRSFPIVSILGLSLLTSACQTLDALSSAEIDTLVAEAMRQFSVPGVAVGVIKDGAVVHAQGYGILEIGLPEVVDENTLFRIASNSKAMTTAALAMLVDEGKLNWDDKVVQHIPDFQLYDDWVTQEFTVTDLLTHRSGLGLGAGDLMLWPVPNHFTRQDIIRGLRYFKPASSFRTQYDYDNQLYIVAGELIPAVSGMQWEEFVDEHILGAMGARRCFAGNIPLSEMHNVAAPHAIVEGSLQVIERNRTRAAWSVSAAAGGVRCSLHDMLTWVDVQLDRGTLADGSQLFSAAQSRIMWSPMTIRKTSDADFERDRTHFKAYGLGWRLADVHGYKEVSHTGTFTGSMSYVTLIPELDLGVVVLINASAGNARKAIMYSIVRAYLGVTDVNWVGYFSPDKEQADGAQTEYDEIDYRYGHVDAPLSRYVGRYRDPWFGDVIIRLEGDQLWFDSVKSPRMTGPLWPYREHTFIARWSDRTLQGDAFVTFDGGAADTADAISMRAASDDVDFSFNYGDLEFRRVGDE
ncbi:MAG: serine hydrolase [Proteobacteria bacterium]|nr:serine hydrolase [Pseudomonadota bacterium]